MFFQGDDKINYSFRSDKECVCNQFRLNICFQSRCWAEDAILLVHTLLVVLWFELQFKHYVNQLLYLSGGYMFVNELGHW